MSKQHYRLWIDKYKERRGQIIRELNNYKHKIDEIKSRIPCNELIKPLEARDAKIDYGKLCFVDGGEGIRELLGAGVYFIRASGLITSGKEGEDFFVRDLDVNIIDYDEHTKERVELLREAMEFDVALKCVKEHRPECLFLDGSLYVKSRRKPIECSEYQVYRKKLTRLLKTCKSDGVKLVGVSEDSKSKLFANHLGLKYNIKFPKFMTDSSILKMLTEEHDVFQTVDFTPQSRFEADSQMDGSLISSFPTMYLKPTPLSNPLRIDVPDWNHESLSELIALVTHLCQGSRHYGYPLPMYLVHLDAHISERHADWSKNQLVHYIQKNAPQLANAILCRDRRGSRPRS